MTNGYSTPIGVPIGLPLILSLGLPPLVNPYPTLNLDFIQNPQFDSRITFSRGSQATLFDSAGKLVYAKQNLLTYSDDFANPAWSKTDCSVISNTIVAPDGTLSGDKLIENNAANTGNLNVAPSLLNNTAYSGSVFAKAGEWGWIAIEIRSETTNVLRAWFNISTGAVGTVQSGMTASITSVGNGWYRCVATRTSGPTNSSTRFRLISTNADNTTSTGDGTSGIYVWGAQLNQNPMEGGVTSSLTTYYPTTTAAYYAPRFDYNPSTLQPRGLLIEEQRTNSILQSEDFATTWVATSATITTNAIVSPSGLITADKMIVDNGVSSGSSSLHQEVTKAASSITYTLSMFAKKGEADTLRLLPRDTATSANNADARFNLDAGTVISVTAAGTFTNASAAIQNIGNGWYRCSTTFTSGTEISIRNRIYQQKAGANFTGNGTDGIYIWGYQFEAGAFATSYIPTTTTALTRNADVATMTGTNFSSWFNASEGTFVAQYFPNAVAPATAGQNVFNTNDGTSLNAIQLAKRANVDASTRYTTDAGGSGQTFSNLGVFTATQTTTAVAYKENDFAGIKSGGSLVTDTLGTVPTLNRMVIGADRLGATSFLNGHIQRLAYYPTRLPNTTLQALTA